MRAAPSFGDGGGAVAIDFIGRNEPRLWPDRSRRVSSNGFNRRKRPTAIGLVDRPVPVMMANRNLKAGGNPAAQGREAVMAEGRRGISFRRMIAAAGLAAAIGAIACFALVVRRASSPTSSSASKAAFEANPTSSIPELSSAVRRGDGSALAELARRILTPSEEQVSKPFEAEEGRRWILAVADLRAGFPKFAPGAQATALNIVGAIFQKAAIEPAPATWTDALPPSQDLFVSGMMRREAIVRVAALGEVAKFWSWLPGRSLMPVEEEALGRWKESFYEPAKRSLSDSDPHARAAAVACLAGLAIDEAAEPAVAYVADAKSAEVRKQALISFASRPTLLSEEAILPRLHDDDPAVVLVAEKILQGRGLTVDQIRLGREVFHPRPDHRVRAISRLTTRDDIDPLVWLMYLSYDSDERVRRAAVEPLARSASLEAKDRIREMARYDGSRLVQETLRKVAPGIESQAILPPLPGTAGLYPRAN